MAKFTYQNIEGVSWEGGEPLALVIDLGYSEVTPHGQAEAAGLKGVGVIAVNLPLYNCPDHAAQLHKRELQALVDARSPVALNRAHKALILAVQMYV